MIIWTTRIVRIIDAVRVYVGLVCECTLIEQIWCIAFVELIVLFVQNVIFWITQSNTDSQFLSKHEGLHVETGHVEEGIVLLQEDDTRIRHRWILCIGVLENTEVACILLAKDQAVDKHITHVEEELLVLTVMRHHLES